MKLLRYIFYRLHQLMVSVGNGHDATFTTVVLMSMLIGVNIISLIAFTYFFTGFYIDVTFGSKIIIVSEYIVLCLIFYLMFAYKDSYLKIIKYYENESRKSKLNGKIFAISYFILSIVIMVLSFLLIAMKNRAELN